MTPISYNYYDGFLSSSWYTVLRRDFELSNILIFIGYSLYDIDIQKIILNIESLKDRTYFITKKNCNQEELFFFERYGHVIPIGVDEFANIIDNYKFTEDIHTPKYIKLYELNRNAQDIKDSDIEDFLIFGNVNTSLLEECVVHEHGKYAIIREKIDYIKKMLQYDNVVIISEYGNGKTVILKECLPILSRNFKKIYIIDDPYVNYIEDFQTVCSNSDDMILFVLDNYVPYMDLFQYLSGFNKKNIRFLMSARFYNHYDNKDNLIKYNFTYNEIQIDLLFDNEIYSFIDILESIGYWGKKSQERLVRFIKKECRSQLSLILLTLLDSPNIKDKIRQIISPLLIKDNDLKYLTVLALYLCTLDIKIDSHLIAELYNSSIYSSEIKNNYNFKSLFYDTKYDIFKPKSQIFCQKVLKDFVDPNYIIKILLNTADFLNNDNIKKCYPYDLIFESCLRFSSIDKVFPENENKPEFIVKYYESLKNRVTWLQDNPHFWMQYAMGHMGCHNYEKAQRLLDNAYGKAKRRSFYNTESIDTQQARLFMLQSLEEISDEDSLSLFRQGSDLLIRVKNSVYKYRQLYFFNTFYKNKVCFWDDVLKFKFLRVCNRMLSSISGNSDKLEIDEYERKKVYSMIKNIVNYLDLSEVH